MRAQPTIHARHHRRLAFGALVLAGSLLRAGPAQAGSGEICVANDAQLATALEQAENSPLSIKIVRGSYDLRFTPWHIANATIQSGSKLLGGYAPGCATRDIDAGNTIIGDSNPSSIQNGVFPTGSLTIEGLTWTNPNGLLIDADDDILPGFPADSMIRFSRDVFVGVDGGGVTIMWGQDDDAGGTIRFVDTLIAANTGTTCSLWIEVASGSPTVQLVNNTFVDNSGTLDGRGSGVCVTNDYLNDDGNGSLFATNNIFYGNEDNDLYSDAFASLVDNVIGPHSTPFAIELGTLSGNPHLDSDYRPIESPPSPVINSGSNSAPGGLPPTDLPGRDRVVGTAPDRGAYESSINDAFLQTVTNTSDTGAGSLRSALTGAIAHGSGLISFAIGSGCGPHIITLASPLPNLTVPLYINGYTQTGAVANDLDPGDDATLCVILESGNSNVTRGLVVASNADDDVTLDVKGVAFSGFSDAAIDLQAGSFHGISGNHFGGNVGGHSLQPNGIDIRLGVAAHDVLIGGDDVAERNIIGDATGSGIVMQGGASGSLLLGTYNDQVLNNYVGVGWNTSSGNFTNRANGTRGIHLLGHDNTLSDNLIGDNLQAGVLVEGGGAANNVIGSNFIGAAENGAELGNGNAGIHFSGDVGDAPSSNTVHYNTIAENGDEGVWVEIGQHNKIRRNQIFDNGLLGIDLAGEGVMPNDDDGSIQQNDYANRGQNFPVLMRAAPGTVSGTLTTTGGDFTVDVYASGSCDDSGNGEGTAWLKSATVTVTVPPQLDEGTATFDIGIPSVPHFLSQIVAITATATDSSGNTSEFSACVAYDNDTIFADGFDP